MLNMVMFGIARFYQKKLDSKTWSGGFFIAIICIAIALVSSFFTFDWIDHVIAGTLTIAGVLSLWNCSTIYFTMKQTHK